MGYGPMTCLLPKWQIADILLQMEIEKNTSVLETQDLIGPKAEKRATRNSSFEKWSKHWTSVRMSVKGGREEKKKARNSSKRKYEALILIQKGRGDRELGRLSNLIGNCYSDHFCSYSNCAIMLLVCFLVVKDKLRNRGTQ